MNTIEQTFLQSDFNKYLEIPFVDRGRDNNGCDCYGLISLIYKNELNIELEAFGGISVKDRKTIKETLEQESCCSDQWIKVDDPKPGDVVVLNVKGVPTHVGLIINGKNFIHSCETIGCCVESLSSPRWEHRVKSIHRYNV